MQQQPGLVLTETETEPKTQPQSAKRSRLEPASDDDDGMVIKRAQREAREERAAEEAAAETEAGTETEVRFNQKLQIIDVLDVLNVIYGSATSATTAQTKWFGKQNAERTAKALGITEMDLLHKVRWENASRTRLALQIEPMKRFLDIKMKHMQTAVNFLSLLCSGKGLSETPTELEAHSKGGAKRDASVPKDKMEQSERSVVIYMVIYIPEDRAVYIGKTMHEKTRLSAHGSRSSKCRLMRNALRKNGLKNYRLSPILRCKAADADANESEWIIKSNTLFPNGLNLRHGSKAGESADMDSAITPVCSSVIPFSGVADEAAAHAEAWSDIADMAEESTQDTGDDTNNVDVVCKDLLKRVHPDRGGGDRSYTGVEVAAMLNSIREVL